MGQNSRISRKILHTSDLHLGSVGDTACDSLTAVVNLAIRNKTDLLLIAGDLFEHNKIKDDIIHYVIEQLQRLTIPVVILPGNHDCLMPGSPFDRTDLWQDCANLWIFRDPQGETLNFLHLGLSLWGKPIFSQDNDVRPLGGMPTPDDKSQWHIAVAHGYFVGADPPLFPSYHITSEEIADSGRDYFALGHIPVFRCVFTAPLACYSGSPSFSGTCVLVEFAEDTGVRVSRCVLENHRAGDGPIK